jgi:DNA mismatch repair protein MutL
MTRIQQLDPLIINKIAAGEVIERPASVVKELLENSLDALATRISVEVAQGGTELIRVVDDGEGIHPDDLQLAVTSHATSKIRSAEDLFRVQTKGFRGEALASIASVSHFRIRSRRREDDTGYELEVRGGEVGSLQACASPPGTLIEIRQLFANTPVRRKFLKSVATEFGHLSEQFTRIALSHPRLSALLRHNDRTVHELPPTERVLDRLKLFYGSDHADSLIRVESEIDGVRLSGYVGHPKLSKATRKGQYLFLNGRWIQDRSLQHALTEAYRGLLMVGRQPVAYLFLELPPELVDVNVHPTKAEVRFRDAQPLYRQLLSTLRTEFLSRDLDSPLQLPTETKSAQAAANVTSERQQELRLELATWANDQAARWQPDQPATLADRASPPNSGGSAQIAYDSDRTETVGSPERSGSGDSWPPTSGPLTSAQVDQDSADQRNAVATDASSAVAGSDWGTASATANGYSGDGSSSDSQTGRVIQIHDCYLVIETSEGLTVIDQHALHERVMYERLRRRVLGGSVETQKMLVPETIELSPDESAALLENQELLEQIGFQIEEFGKSTVLLSAYPPLLARADRVQIVRNIAEQLCESGQKPTRRDILDSILHMMSCKAAIKAGQKLTPEEMESLLKERHLIDDAHHCPHGRPTALVLSRAELDRQFGRLG